MAGKPELSAGTGVQNVLVYVSSDNFAQAYSVRPQNVEQCAHPGVYNSTYPPPNPMAPVEAPAKTFMDKQQKKHLEYSTINEQMLNSVISRQDYFTSGSSTVISQNGFSQPVQSYILDCKGSDGEVNSYNSKVVKNYNNGEVPNWYGKVSAENSEVNPDTSGNTGGEALSHGVRCESVRSETAESSCSSLSSADDSLVIATHSRTPEMVVYDSGVNEKHGGVMIAMGMPGVPHVQLSSVVQPPMQPSLPVPIGWKRLTNNGEVIYISPSNTALNSLEQVRNYLQTPGTCKCGLECPLKYETVFNFDPKVLSRPTFLSVNNEDLTKLCNHKRKLLSMASAAGHKPIETPKIARPDNNMIRKKRRKIRYADVPIQQPGVQHEQVVSNPKCTTVNAQYQQVWSHAQGNIQQFTYADVNESEQPDCVKYNNAYTEDNRIMIKAATSAPAQTFERLPNVAPQVQCNSPNVHVISSKTSGEPESDNSQYHRNDCNTNVLVQCPDVVPNQQDHRVYVNGRPAEIHGHVRTAFDAVPVNPFDANQKPQEIFCGHQEQYQNVQAFGLNKNMHFTNRFKPQGFGNQTLQGPVVISHPPKMAWPNRMPLGMQNRVPLVNQSPQMHNVNVRPTGVCGRVPPIHQHVSPMSVWTDDFMKKRAKLSKLARKRPGVVGDGAPRRGDVQDVCPNVDVRQIASENNRTFVVNQIPQQSAPSFMEDPSGYLAQQTALLNSTINGQAAGCANYVCQNVPAVNHLQNMSMESRDSGVPLLSNVHMSQQQRHTQNIIAKNQNEMKEKRPINQQPCHCLSQCDPKDGKLLNQPNVSNSSRLFEDRVTSSTQFEMYEESPDVRPIQGGTISTSNVSPSEGSTSGLNVIVSSADSSHAQIVQLITSSSAEISHDDGGNKNISTAFCRKQDDCCANRNVCKIRPGYGASAIITTMASGRTVGSNTITSVVAGRANTATVTTVNPANVPISSTPIPIVNTSGSFSVTKSPLEMVQSVVSSIQVPQPQVTHERFLKETSSPNHILVSSGGQLIMASTASSGGGIMPPPPAKLMQNHGTSAVITNVTTALSQVVPTVGQLGQQAVLVNAVPGSFVLQAGVTMTMDGVAVGQNMQIPHIVAGNVLPQQIQVEGADLNRNNPMMISPDGKKKSRKRKVSTQTVANMLHIAAQQNANVLMSPQGFAQQLHMAHSPQGLNAAPVMQALTIVPGKSNGTAQIVMNGQQLTANAPIGAQQFIANSQTSQQINLLQPVNLLNGTTGMVQHFPTIQQLIVPNLGGMVMNADGTATILQDASNLGVQLQFQNLNGQNILTPVQNNGMFNTGQSILAGTAGMVIRSPNTQENKMMAQPHSPDNHQFLSPNGGQFVLNGAQFNGQLSPLIANVSPTQVSFGGHHPAKPNVQQVQTQQDFVPGQTLMVPCAPQVPTSNQQGATYVQQNTTIVQQQTTMVANNQKYPNINIEQGYVVSPNSLKQNPLMEPSYRHSVSTQTAVNQTAQSVTTNTFCQTSMISASSSPDTTTHSPMACGSPPDGDAGHHDGGNRPHCLADVESGLRHAQQSASCLAMVHCVSSSKPDSTELVVHHGAEYGTVKSDLQMYEAEHNESFKKHTKSAEKWSHELKCHEDVDNDNRCSSVFIND